ncbi:hypothetical protein [Phytoactinopolyspora limicola]|uniref:hypothetical protein n=1 Tax=Phytoactinopolyspora limicola TaxID=2715536 RepID=UPI00140CFC38|nr:hypothetical protein [Phytoactinopolyspora limicola]
MKFAQVIELKTGRLDEIMELDQEWTERTEGARPYSVEFWGTDRDRPDTYVGIVVWDSYEDAQKNNDLPATHDFATRMAELCDEPPVFRNLDVLRERR